tara:strand:+ start:20 stop:835 length:816 start_codon:yes stop_codon:yes gene_type:complete
MALRGITIEATPAVAPFSFLLDDYSGADIALSLRKLDSTYTGPAIGVYNGSTSIDIGFVDNELDTAAIAAHCGSNDGLITTWYDQSGNGNDMIQLGTPIRNPQIYDGATGQVEMENGKPIIKALLASNLDGLNTYTGVSDATIFATIAPGAGSAGEILLGDTSDAYNFVAQNSGAIPTKNSGTATWRINNTDLVPSASFMTRADMHNATRSQTIVTTHFDSTVYDTITMGYDPNPGAYTMFSTQEFILFNSDKTSDESAIELEMNDYYSAF